MEQQYDKEHKYYLTNKYLLSTEYSYLQQRNSLYSSMYMVYKNYQLNNDLVYINCTQLLDLCNYMYSFGNLKDKHYTKLQYLNNVQFSIISTDMNVYILYNLNSNNYKFDIYHLNLRSKKFGIIYIILFDYKFSSSASIAYIVQLLDLAHIHLSTFYIHFNYYYIQCMMFVNMNYLQNIAVFYCSSNSLADRLDSEFDYNIFGINLNNIQDCQGKMYINKEKMMSNAGSFLYSIVRFFRILLVSLIMLILNICRFA